MHSFVAYVLGAIFLVVQIFFYSRARKTLKDIESDWLKWAIPEANAGRGRDELLERLESRIAFEKWRLWLKRLGPMAPMIGIAITAVGFLLMNFESSSIDMGTTGGMVILNQLRPLYLGVLIGVVLALINQVLLAEIDGQMSRIRLSCELRLPAPAHDVASNVLVEFEDTVRKITNMSKARMEAAVSESELQASEFSKSLTRASQTIESISADYNQNRKLLATAATSLEQAVQAATRGMNVAISSAQSSISQSVSTMSVAIQKGGDGIQASTTKLNTTIQTFGSCMTSLEQQVRTLGATTQQIQTASLDAVANAQSLGKQVRESVAPALQTAVASISEIAGNCEERFRSASEDSAAEAKKLYEGLRATIQSSLQSVTQAMQSVTRECERSAMGLTVASKSLAEQMGQGSQEIIGSSNALARQLPKLNDAMESLSTSLKRQENLAKDTSEQIKSLLQTVGNELTRNINRQAETVGQRLWADLSPTLKAAGDAVGKSSQSCEQTIVALSQVVNSLNEGAGAIESGSAQLTVTTGNLGEKMDHLEKGLRRMAHVMKEQEVMLGRLPDSLAASIQSLVFASDHNALHGTNSHRTHLHRTDGDHGSSNESGTPQVRKPSLIRRVVSALAGGRLS